MKRTIVLIPVFILFSIGCAWATGEHLQQKKEESNVPGLNIKVSPAFYWKTLGLELEYVVSPKFSIGLNLFGRWGLTSPESHDSIKYNFIDNGIRTELAFKYYLKGTAPEGFYIQANAAYNTINYFNGSIRPYTLLNIGLSEQAIDQHLKSKPYSAGLGIGYQLIIIPNVLVGNILLGVQGSIDGANKPFVSIYTAPSIGILF